MAKAPFLPEKDIETASLLLLSKYETKFGRVEQPPVPVEEMIESHLGLNFGFDDLVKRLGVSDVLGATWIATKEVIIDLSLDPTVDPSKKGRYMFTVAHELGHWELHRHLFPASYGQRGLFSEKNAPTIVCRTSSRKDPMEWQADCFAGYLLMPQEMVVTAWKAARGALEPYEAVQEIADKSAKWGLVEDQRPTVDIARQLAAEFDVSGQAMQIRLIGLGLIQMSQRQPKLFSNQAKPQEQEVKPITT